MKMQRLLSLLRQAADNYQMIDQDDHIAVGISGGKDSLTLLCGLHSLQRFYPKHFSLSAITVDLGLGNLDLEPIKALSTVLYSEVTIIASIAGTEYLTNSLLIFSYLNAS